MIVHRVNKSNENSLLVIDLPFTCSCGYTDVFMVPMTRTVEDIEFEQSVYLCQNCECDDFPAMDFEL